MPQTKARARTTLRGLNALPPGTLAVGAGILALGLTSYCFLVVLACWLWSEVRDTATAASGSTAAHTRVGMPDE